MATQAQKSNVVSEIRRVCRELCGLVGDIQEIDAAFIAHGLAVGEPDPLVQDNLAGNNADIPVAQVAAALTGLRSFAATYASGTGARSALERVI